MDNANQTSEFNLAAPGKTAADEATPTWITNQEMGHLHITTNNNHHTTMSDTNDSKPPATTGLIHKPQKRSRTKILEEAIPDILKCTVVIEGTTLIIVNTAVVNQKDEWKLCTEKEFANLLTKAGFRKDEIGYLRAQLLAHPDAQRVAKEHYLTSYLLCPAGFQIIDGEAYFVRKSSAPPSPDMGNPIPVLRAILRLFHKEADIFLGWLQGAVKVMLNYLAERNGQPLPYEHHATQTLCICGSQGTGKSYILIFCILDSIFGGHADIPTSWLTGKSSFADWMVPSFLYVSDDNQVLNTPKARSSAAAAIKSIGYPSQLSCECKGKGAISLKRPNLRVFVCNTDEYALDALPDISHDGDKYLVLHNCAPGGFDKDYQGDSTRMGKELQEAIPAFLYWLLHEYKIPQWAVGTQGTRHAVMNLGMNRGYVSGPIAASLFYKDQVGAFLRLLRRVVLRKGCYGSYEFNYRKDYTALTLREEIEGYTRRSLTVSDKILGSMLKECSERFPMLIVRKRSAAGYKYTLSAPQKWTENLSSASVSPSGVVPEFNPELLKLANLTETELRAAVIPVVDDEELPDEDSTEGGEDEMDGFADTEQTLF